MLVADWEAGSWKQPQIVPFGPISFSPALTPFHYGQAIFEGFKAHRTANRGLAQFRPRENFARMNRSATRLAMPEIPESLFLDGVTELVQLDRDWVPYREGGSLYVRPTYFGVDDTLLVRPANRFRLIVMTSPVGPYFSQPIRLLAEERFVRAFPGGTGDSKAAGNYAGGLLAARLAQEKGFHNVLWLDGVERRYVEESGVMNVFFVLDGKAITPPLSGTILPGVTRDSALTLLREIGVPAEERQISIDEVLSAHAAGKLTEAFGAGTGGKLLLAGAPPDPAARPFLFFQVNKKRKVEAFAQKDPSFLNALAKKGKAPPWNVVAGNKNPATTSASAPSGPASGTILRR